MINIEQKHGRKKKKLKFLRSAHTPEIEEQKKQHLAWFKEEVFIQFYTNADILFKHIAEVLVAVFCYSSQKIV